MLTEQEKVLRTTEYDKQKRLKAQNLRSHQRSMEEPNLSLSCPYHLPKVNQSSLWPLISITRLLTIIYLYYTIKYINFQKTTSCKWQNILPTFTVFYEWNMKTSSQNKCCYIHLIVTRMLHTLTHSWQWINRSNFSFMVNESSGF